MSGQVVCAWCGQKQSSGEGKVCELCAEKCLDTPPADSAREGVRGSSSQGRPPAPLVKWVAGAMVVALVLLAVWLVPPFLRGTPSSADTPTATPTKSASAKPKPSVPAFKELPKGAKDCKGGVAVAGAASCEFGAEVAKAYRSAKSASGAKTIALPQVNDPIRKVKMDVVCTIAKPAVCALSKTDIIYIAA